MFDPDRLVVGLLGHRRMHAADNPYFFFYVISQKEHQLLYRKK